MSKIPQAALITDAAEFDKAVSAWALRGKKWADDGHTLALSALTMTAKHNDVGPVNRLLLAMPKGTKVTAMKSWLLAYGALAENADKASVSTKPLIYTKDKEYDVAAGSQDPWFNHKAETAQDPVFDLQKAIEQIINKAQGKTLMHGDLLTGLQALIVSIKPGAEGEIVEADEEAPSAN